MYGHKSNRLDKTAAGADEIGEALQRTASTADNFGVSLERASAWLATISSVTRESASTIGRSLNSILSRYTQIRAKGFNDEDATNLNEVVKALTAVGVQALDSTGQLRDFTEVMDDLGAIYPSLTENEKAYVTTVLAGTYQRNRLITLLNNYNDSLKNYELALNAAGTAQKKFDIWMESPQAKLDKFKATLDGLWQDTLNSQQIKNVIDFGIALLNIADYIGLVNIALIAIGGFISSKLLFQVTAVSTAFKGLAVSIGLSEAAAAGLLGIAGALVIAFGVMVIKAVNENIVTLEEQREKVAQLSSEVDKLSSKIEILKSKSFLTPNEASYLKYLETQLTLQKQLLEVEMLRAAQKEFETDPNRDNWQWLVEIIRNVLGNDAADNMAKEVLGLDDESDNLIKTTTKQIEDLNKAITQYSNISDEAENYNIGFDFDTMKGDMITQYGVLQDTLDKINEYELVLGDKMPDSMKLLKQNIEGVLARMIQYGILADENAKKEPIPTKTEDVDKYIPPVTTKELTDQVKQAADTMKDLSDLYDILTDKDKTLADAVEYLVDNYDDLVAAGVDVEYMLAHMGDAEELVAEAYEDQVAKRGVAYEKMIGFTESYMNISGKAWNDYSNQLNVLQNMLVNGIGKQWANMYTGDAKAFASYVKAKLNATKDALRAVQGANASWVNATIANIDSQIAAIDKALSGVENWENVNLPSVKPTSHDNSGGGSSSKKMSAYLQGILSKIDARISRYDKAIDREKKELALLKDQFEQQEKINEILKAREELNNILNERDTRMLVGSEWQWVADPRKVREAKEKLDELERKKREDDAIRAQEKIIEKLEEQKDIWLTMKSAINDLSDSAKHSIKNWDALIAALKKAGLLPDSVPKLATGGEVKESGAAVIHKGEGVLKPEQNKAFKTFVQNITKPSSLMSSFGLPTAISNFKNMTSNNSGGNIIIQSLQVVANNPMDLVNQLNNVVPLGNRIGRR